MPPYHKNLSHTNQQPSTLKQYDPISWELYFEELFFLSDVPRCSLRALRCFEQASREPFSFVSMAQATQP